jgi:uncharacterized damage-inducible protein DinB
MVEMTVSPLLGYPLSWGAAMWEMEDTRRRTLEAVDGLDQGLLDGVLPGGDNSIGSLLYHLAVIEADWLYADILTVDYPEWMTAEFPKDARDHNGRLTKPAATLEGHLRRLAVERSHFLAELTGLPDADFTRPRQSESGVSTPQWVVHHLNQHEAEHRGQIQTIRPGLEGKA